MTPQSGSPLSPPIHCEYCGRSASLDDKDVVVDTVAGTASDVPLIHVWHHRCFDTYLDEGEET